MTPEAKALRVCELMEDRMRAAGVVTTAHYESGVSLIAEALREAYDDGAASALFGTGRSAEDS
jgi:hypothetical protein